MWPHNDTKIGRLNVPQAPQSAHTSVAVRKIALDILNI